MKRILFMFLLLYLFAILQMSFFVHFFPAGFILNLIVLAVIVLSIFEGRDSYASLGAALFGGFLMDVFSGGIIGFWPLVLLAVSLAIKKILEAYVRFPIPKKF